MAAESCRPPLALEWERERLEAAIGTLMAGLEERGFAEAEAA